MIDGKRGLFIVLEGISGGGKNTQVHYVARDLFERSVYENVLVTCEPTDGVYGRKARLLAEEFRASGKADPFALAREFTADRLEHGCFFWPLLIRGVHVACNRYYHSTYVYQVKQGVPFDQMREMQRQKTIVRPDLTLLLDVPGSVAAERLTKRGESGAKVEKIEDLRGRYAALAALLPDERIEIIDGLGSAGDVFARMKPHIDALWKERYGSEIKEGR